MKNAILLMFILIFAISCNFEAISKVSYESYYNERFDYAIEYPTFLLPLPEADIGDGRKFVSKNGASSMIVYRDVKIDQNSDFISSLIKAHDLDKEQYNLDSEVKISQDEVFENYYKFSGSRGRKYFVQITIYANLNFFTILFEYEKSDKKKFNEIIDYVVNSFNVGESETDATSPKADETISNFLTKFLDDCFWGKNMNKMLVEKNEEIMKYIDPKLDVRRYYNPGAIALIYNRKKGFGFGANDFIGVSNNNNQLNVVPFFLSSPCEFNLDGNDDGVYYSMVESVKDSVNPETLESFPIKLPSKYKEILKVHIVGEKIRLRTLYFVKSSESNWMLAFIDDSECSG